MLVSFTLSMPGKASWDGKWNNESNLYARVKSFQSKKDIEQIKSILGKRFSYRWDDGWRAAVNVELINSSQARKIRKNSQGFCGYDWMITSILEKGCIKT